MTEGNPGNLYLVADELRAIANAGLRYAANDYDRDRYERVLGLSARLVAALDDRPAAGVLAEYRGNLDRMFPAVGADAVVIRAGTILLIRRSDDGLWAMPGGGVDVGETLAEAATRELHEETGLEGNATRLLGVWDSRLVGSPLKFHLYHVSMLVEADGDPIPCPPETTEAAFFAGDSLPPLSGGHQVIVPKVLKLLANDSPAYFDPELGSGRYGGR
ncbi:MAG: NUDIX hydrolase N-terminal domain-containing protein [Dehalococcoidia bacterium]